MSENELLQLSPSRISDFQQCPALYKYRALDKLLERPGIDALRGSLVHLILEKMYKANRQDRTFEIAVESTRQCWDDLILLEPELVCALDSNLEFPLVSKPLIPEDRLLILFAEVKTLLANYFQLEDPTRFDPESTEELIDFDLSPNLKIKGYVDRIDKSPQGWIRINDYKTGKSPNENFTSKAMFQLKFYALVIFKKTGSIPKMLRLIYLKDSQILTYEPDERDLDITLNKVLNISEQISDSKSKNHWPTRVSKLCDYCYFKPICPEFAQD